MPTEHESLGKIIEDLVNESGLTAYRVSQLIGAGPNFVRNVIAADGKGISLEMFRGVCAAVGVEPAKVLKRMKPFELLEVEEKGRGRPRKTVE